MPLRIAAKAKNRCFKHHSKKLIAASQCCSLKGITTAKVTTSIGLSEALDLRWTGYKKYGISRDDVSDQYDRLDSTSIFNAYNKSGDIVGTLRIIKRASAGLEVENYLNLDDFDFFANKKTAEASRFSISCRVNPLQVKILLWKTAMLYCRDQGIDTLLVWVRKGAMHDYLQLQYRTTGKAGVFSHTDFNHKPHQLLYCKIQTMEHTFKQTKHPLYGFFFG